MPRPLRGNIADLIQTLFVVGVVGDLTDSELLERFTSDRNGESEAAFRVLIVRHGPMVWRVCRSVLADSHDAQDAFQATFLVLVRKANGLWVAIRSALGCIASPCAWAKTVRRAASHRRAHERAAAVTSIVLHDEPADDVATLLHEEINRLPALPRAPIVLCDLDGLTHEHAGASSAGRSEPSRAASHAAENVSVTASPVAASVRRSRSSPCPLRRPPDSPA